MNRELILILDFGSQYTQLIARRIREQNVYSEIHPYNLSLDAIRLMKPSGIVLSGGGWSPASRGSLASAARPSPRVTNQIGSAKAW